jgi:hypothetical protein
MNRERQGRQLLPHQHTLPHQYMFPYQIRSESTVLRAVIGQRLISQRLIGQGALRVSALIREASLRLRI